MKKVSVIIPTYHSDETLKRAIDSVLAQTYSNIEVVVADDNDPSSEFRKNTESLMECYAGDSRVIYVKHCANKNGAAARNTAFRASSGDYIAFLDDDDFYLEKKLEFQVQYLDQNPNFGGCYCWRMDKGKEIKGTYVGDFSYEILALIFTPYTSAVMIRRECYERLNGFDESYYRHQDFEFLLRFFQIYKMGYIPYIGLVLSTNGVNNTPKGEKLVKIKEHFFNSFSNLIEKIGLESPEKKRIIYANHFAIAFKDLIRYGHPWLAFQLYLRYGIKGGIKFWIRLFDSFEYAIKDRLHIINKTK